MTATEIQVINVAALVSAPENVRRTNTHAGHEELKASIMAEGGILQNLIVYATGYGKFAVAGGGRRRKALAALIKEKKLPKTYAVACLVRSRGEAVALSLAENGVREAMHPADEYEAYAALIDQGKSAEDVAARYGVTPAVVTRRLKLAKVAAAVLVAFREGKINLEVVMGFTVSDDHAELERVLADLMERGGRFDRQTVLRMLTHEKVGTDDPRFIYVTEAAYLAAGGVISRDLFDEEGGGYASDSALLDRLTIAKLEGEVSQLLAEGWKWAEPVVDCDFAMRRRFARIHARHLSLSDEDTARQEIISTRLDEIVEETGNHEPDEGPLAEEYARLMAEQEAIEAREWIYDPAELALAGGWLALDDAGKPYAEMGYVKPEDIAALDALRQADRAARDEDSEQVEAEDDGPADMEDDAGEGDNSVALPSAPVVRLPDALLTDLHAARTVALRLEVAERPDIALRLVAHSLAAQIVKRCGAVAQIKVHQTYIPAISQTHCPSDEALKARIGNWALRLPDDGAQLWDAVLALSDDDLLDLIAACTAVSLDVTHSKFQDHSSRQRMAHADQLATTLELDMAKHWTPTADNFFSRVSKAMITDAVTEAVSPEAARRLDGLKKPVMIEEAAKVVDGTGWLPVPLRTQGLALTAARVETEAV